MKKEGREEEEDGRPSGGCCGTSLAPFWRSWCLCAVGGCGGWVRVACLCGKASIRGGADLFHDAFCGCGTQAHISLVHIPTPPPTGNPSSISVLSLPLLYSLLCLSVASLPNPTKQRPSLHLIFSNVHHHLTGRARKCCAVAARWPGAS